MSLAEDPGPDGAAEASAAGSSPAGQRAGQAGPRQAGPRQAGPGEGGPAPPVLGTSGQLFADAVELHRAGRLESAASLYGRLLQREPDHFEALNNLGAVAQARGLPLAAVAAYRRALVLRPDDAGLLNNLGGALRALGRRDEALAVLHQAVAKAPRAPGIHHNLGLVLRDLGHFPDSLACFDRSLEIWPNNVRVRLDKALALLSAGDLRAGFEALESRFDLPGYSPPRDAPPRWTGGPLEGRTLLVRAEQSARDTLQFARFLPVLRGHGGRVVFECQRELVPLFSAMEGLAGVRPMDETPAAADLQVSLLSLPHILRSSLDSIPGRFPYLAPPAGAGFDLHHPDGARLSLGIAWGLPWSDKHTAGLAPFFELLQLPHIAVYSLQTGATAKEIGRRGAVGLLHELGHLLRGYDDLSRVMQQLDLVVTSDQTTAMLAGALSRPVWLILPANADWRWTLEQDTTPWFPTMRLFRQPDSGDWQACFSEVGRKLRALVGG